MISPSLDRFNDYLCISGKPAHRIVKPMPCVGQIPVPATPNVKMSYNPGKKSTIICQYRNFFVTLHQLIRISGTPEIPSMPILFEINHYAITDMKKVLALLFVVLTIASCNEKTPQDLFNEQKSGVVLILNEYYYTLTMPNGNNLASSQ